jgi:hypothetical protein
MHIPLFSLGNVIAIKATGSKLPPAPPRQM